MPTATLQRAAQIRNRINTATEFSVNPTEPDPYGYRRRGHKVTKNTFNLTVNLNVDGNVVPQADEFRKVALDKKNLIFTLMGIGTRIRTAMAAKQTECGVAPLVTLRVEIDQKIKMLDYMVGEVATAIYDRGALGPQAEIMRQRLNTASRGEATTAAIKTPVLTAEDREMLTQELRGLKSELMRLDDKLASLNAINSIAIRDEDMRILEAEGLA
jgi:hypothetical protein